MNKTDTVMTRARTTAIVAAIGFLVVAIFRLALALGALLGRAAYGGGQAELAVGYRAVSAVAVVFWILAALVVLRRGSVRATQFSDRFVRRGTWALMALSVVAALMNLASSSGWKRFGWAPFSLVLAALCFAVAKSPSPVARR
jgi:hypothetical protein